jgi:hypothetical protein
MRQSRFLKFAIKEFKEIIVPTLFFAISFNIVVLTTQLILDDYFAQFANFFVATAAALVVGKAVLVANTLPFLRHFDRAPLIQPILFKTVVYFSVVFVVRVLEKIVEYLFSGGTLAGNFSWHRFAAIQIWIFVLFLIYVSATEFNSLFGDGELAKILFTRRSSELKLDRRQRIRKLTSLSRLTDSHTLEELEDLNSAAHREMIGLISGLSRSSRSRSTRLPTG